MNRRQRKKNSKKLIELYLIQIRKERDQQLHQTLIEILGEPTATRLEKIPMRREKRWRIKEKQMQKRRMSEWRAYD